jgi:Ni,Fe-hydrogenase III small subunit
VRGPLIVAERFAHSLGIRHLVCGSCNGCEHEMNALTNPFYDITADGWDVVASPRHADVITVTGPMTDAMREAAQRTVEAAPRPFVVMAVGDCAAGAGPWAGAPSAGAGAGIELRAAVTVIGCPPTPDAIRAGLAQAARRLRDGGAPAPPTPAGDDRPAPEAELILWRER